MGKGSGTDNGTVTRLTLEAQPEKRLIRPSGSKRHVDFHIRVAQQRPETVPERAPVTLALVLDRSGSMAGGQLATAKRAALAVFDRLDERDRAAVVVFDNEINVIQPATNVTPKARHQLREMLSTIEARGSTALHEGWLTGCQAIAGESRAEADNARCLLLTDGLANVGLTDPEEIAVEAADIRKNAGISTSTFGIGSHYDEFLLGPMAVAGSGQFHHLRTPADIASTFLGELGGLLAVAAHQVCLEIETGSSIDIDVISAYWLDDATEDGTHRHVIALGDLLGGDERHVVVRFHFPPDEAGQTQPVRSRLVWSEQGTTRHTAWQDVTFAYADHDACSAEERDPAVMHWVGLHHADWAQREAVRLNRRGDLAGAQARVAYVQRRYEGYSDDDAELGEAMLELRMFRDVVAEAPMPSMAAKETLSRAQRRSRGQRDHREPEPERSS